MTSINTQLLMENPSTTPEILRAVVSVDCLILRFDDGRLRTLLTKEDSAAHWCLPRRLMRSDESASETSAKLVQEFIPESKPYMEQVHTCTDIVNNQPHPTISITYIALINEATNKQNTANGMWHPISNLPSVQSDDRAKIGEAMTALRRKATYDPLYFDLLPEKFTLPQLRKLFEEMYGENFDQRNFNKKFKALGLLIKLNEKETSQSRKGAFYYMFDRNKYVQMERPVLKFAHLLY